jgi:hypothetical protein
MDTPINESISITYIGIVKLQIGFIKILQIMKLNEDILFLEIKPPAI